MEERLREMFRQEMSGEQEPPLAGLVERAVRDGRRARRARRAWFGLGVTGVGAALAASAFVAMPGNGARPSLAPRKGPVPVLAASSTSTVIKQPRGPKLPVTDAAVVEQLTRLVPHGRTSGYAGGPEEQGRYAFGQVYLDTGKGPGMIRAFVYKGGLSPKVCSGRAAKESLTSKKKQMLKVAKTERERQAIQRQIAQAEEQKQPHCRDLPGGGRALVHTDASGESSAMVDHGDGVVVEVFTATWLAWNGKENPPGTVALTPAQVLKIAAYPGWGAEMDAALVRKAATDHRSLPTVY